MPRNHPNGLAALRAELASHVSTHSNLSERLAKIGREIEALEAEFAKFEGGAGNGVRRRGRRARVAKATKRRAPRGRKGSSKGPSAKGQDLASVLLKVLGGASKPMGIAAIAEAAKKAGYKSSSPAFPRIVGMRLSTDKRFKRAGYGEYTVAK
jgi:hypothetical protein